ncbi:MAG: hypothetical protein FJ246_11900, partial [Nitrospira sp.]|nr:hypothetical protein [Nitrospira sp.]
SSASAQQVMWKDNPITGKVVGLTYGTSSWTAAEAQAVAYGGHLVTLRSTAERNWLAQQFSSVWTATATFGPGYGPWIGLYEDFSTSPSEWRWASSEVTPGYSLEWLPGEPNNVGGTEDYANLHAPNWLLNDFADFQPMKSLIEVAQRPPRSWSWPVDHGVPSDSGPCCIADLDEDGDPDVVATTYFGALTVWRNDNGMLTTVGAPIWMPAQSPYPPVAFDYDKDGDLDICAIDGASYTSVLSVAFCTGLFQYSSFQQVWNLPYADSLHVADVDRDGNDDLLVGSSISGNRVLIAFPAGGTGLVTVPSFSFASQRGGEVEDLDRDGLADWVAWGGSGNGTVEVMWGDPGALFASAQILASSTLPIAGGAVGDIDGDGDVDLILSEGSAYFRVWTQAGRIFYPGPFVPIADGFAFHRAILRDLDGDGRNDLCMATNGNSILTYRNDGSSLVYDMKLLEGRGSRYLGTADFDADGLVDILSSNAYSLRSFSIVFNQAQTDCNGNGVHDAVDISVGFAVDCNGNGRPDSCDLAFGFSQDSNGNGFLDECEPTLVSITPAVRPAFQQSVVTVSTTNIPNGMATLTLTSAAFATPVVRAVSIVNNAGTVTLPALAAPSASDVVAAGTLAFTDAQGNAVVTAVTPGVFT